MLFQTLKMSLELIADIRFDQCSSIYYCWLLDGSIIAFLLQPGEMMASDGYGWMDDDSLTRVTLDNGIVGQMLGVIWIYTS